MSSTTRGLVALSAAVVVLAGCAPGVDDEIAPRPAATRTVTAPPPPAQSALPASVPFGTAGLSPRAAAWAQGSRLGVRGLGTRDLSPLRVDAFVVTPGGIYFLHGDHAWYTDLTVVKDTGISAATTLAASADGRLLRVAVRTPAGDSAERVYDTGTGLPAPNDEFTPASEVDLLGEPVRVDLGDTVRLRGDATTAARLGPGRAFGLVTRGPGAIVPFDARTGRRVDLAGAVPSGLDLVGWTGPSAFYGLDRTRARAVVVTSCDLVTRRCRRLAVLPAPPDGSGQVVVPGGR